ncbi:cytochrome c oxidase, subunit II [Desmospora sp. 8437]|nr:cytochrome c oxidase, subunit II [Desmospora sp. 8437]
MEPDWMNQLIIPLGVDLAVFIVKALIVAFLASWLLKKYVQPFLTKRSPQVNAEQIAEESNQGGQDIDS